MAARPTRIDLVYADWCPHCVPLSTDLVQGLSALLQVPVRRLDIDDRVQEAEADRLVERYGDFTPDYLIPQVFLERADGSVEHLLTGIPGNPSEGTKAEWERVLRRFAAEAGSGAPNP
jgi:hypothetical protein